jgi:hypothetical protein
MNQPSKGLAMIAAYRAARLNQRPTLRTSLQPAPALTHAEPGIKAEPMDHSMERLVTETADEGSVFASMVNLTQTPAAEPIETSPAAVPHPEPEPDILLTATSDPPLAEIGFGPGMLIRLSQLGLHTTGDLAQAEPEALRAALGEISRLVDVEAWITSARQTASAARKFTAAELP